MKDCSLHFCDTEILKIFLICLVDTRFEAGAVSEMYKFSVFTQERLLNDRDDRLSGRRYIKRIEIQISIRECIMNEKYHSSMVEKVFGNFSITLNRNILFLLIVEFFFFTRTTRKVAHHCIAAPLHHYLTRVKDLARFYAKKSYTMKARYTVSNVMNCML